MLQLARNSGVSSTPQPDHQADRDQHHAGHERDPPAVGLERVLGHDLAEQREHPGTQRQAEPEPDLGHAAEPADPARRRVLGGQPAPRRPIPPTARPCRMRSRISSVAPRYRSWRPRPAGRSGRSPRPSAPSSRRACACAERSPMCPNSTPPIGRARSDRERAETREGCRPPRRAPGRQFGNTSWRRGVEEEVVPIDGVPTRLASRMVRLEAGAGAPGGNRSAVVVTSHSPGDGRPPSPRRLRERAGRRLPQPRERNTGARPRPTHHASSRCGWPDRMNSSMPARVLGDPVGDLGVLPTTGPGDAPDQPDAGQRFGDTSSRSTDPRAARASAR